VSVANAISEQMARDMAIKLEDEIFNGTGGNFTGLRDTGSFTNSVSAGATIAVTHLSNAVDEIHADNMTSPDVGYFNTRVIGDLRNLTDGSARPLFNQETFGSPLLKTGVIGTVYGFGVKPANNLSATLSYGTGSAATASDAIIGISKQFGYYATRRRITLHQDYDIDVDLNQYQANMRAAFNIKYANAYAVIRAIHV